MRGLFFIASLLFLSGLNSQNLNRKDTVFVRYNGEISNDFRFNTIKLYTLESDSIYSVTEVYRFTNPPSVKSQHEENLDRVNHGAFVLRYANGNIIEKGNYINGKRNGDWTTYKKEKLSSKIPYKNGKKEGLAYYYYLDDKYYTGVWKDDKPTGKKIKYNNEGSLIFDGEYINGDLTGNNIWYYPNGNKEKEATYSAGKLHGKFMSWYKNGGIESEGNYNKGNYTGNWIWYKENGKIASKEIYTNKGKIKKAIFYDELGNENNGKRHLEEGVITERRRLNRIIRKHVRDNFLYPKEMQEKGFEGRVYVVFKIDIEGRIIDLQTRGDAHPVLVETAKEIVKSLPKQEPARVHNRLIEVQLAVPVVFHINL